MNHSLHPARAAAAALLVMWFAALTLVAPRTASGQPAADLALVLAIDCSWSVDAREFELQVSGTARAFLDPEILKAIANGPNGRILVAVVQWSSDESQVLSVPWTPVSNAADALALAARIKAQVRQTAEGATSISGAILASMQALTRLPAPAARYVIDVSGDGTNNRGARVDDVRDEAAAAGITINGLAILNEVHWLHHYYRNHVIAGPGAFVEIAGDYGAYREAIRRKILREIRGNWVS